MILIDTYIIRKISKKLYQFLLQTPKNISFRFQFWINTFQNFNPSLSDLRVLAETSFHGLKKQTQNTSKGKCKV